MENLRSMRDSKQLQKLMKKYTEYMKSHIRDGYEGMAIATTPNLDQAVFSFDILNPLTVPYLIQEMIYQSAKAMRKAIPDYRVESLVYLIIMQLKFQDKTLFADIDFEELCRRFKDYTPLPPDANIDEMVKILKKNEQSRNEN